MRFNLSVLNPATNLPKPLRAREVSGQYRNRAQRVGGPQAIVRADLIGMHFHHDDTPPYSHIIEIPRLNLKVLVSSSGVAERNILRTHNPSITILNTELYVHYTLDAVEGESEREVDEDF